MKRREEGRKNEGRGGGEGRNGRREKNRRE